MDASDELLQRPTPSALVALDGAVLSLNTAMARALGRSVEQCLGHGFGDLLPASQLTSVESLVAHAATTDTARCGCWSSSARRQHRSSVLSRRDM
ncbi:PAS domain-containing protein [Streptomyces sp. NRRL F-5122]|uniref:PAS domain-containing protein n=1 Tax=Streptomyces sp. NRRL F-5122 TaxID=1609098 RepID=UPI00131BF6AA